jgi:hypothetical protein
MDGNILLLDQWKNNYVALTNPAIAQHNECEMLLLIPSVPWSLPFWSLEF